MRRRRGSSGPLPTVQEAHCNGARHGACRRLQGATRMPLHWESLRGHAGVARKALRLPHFRNIGEQLCGGRQRHGVEEEANAWLQGHHAGRHSQGWEGEGERREGRGGGEERRRRRGESVRTRVRGTRVAWAGVSKRKANAHHAQPPPPFPLTFPHSPPTPHSPPLASRPSSLRTPPPPSPHPGFLSAHPTALRS